MYAKLFSQKSGFPMSENISQSDRFCLFKTGPVLWVNVSFELNLNSNKISARNGRSVFINYAKRDVQAFALR
jgi:hypothetical protein